MSIAGYILSTARLGLRRFVAADVNALATMNRDEAVMKYFPALLTEAQTIAMMQRIDEHFEKNGFGLFAVENIATKEFIGLTGFAIPAFESFFTPCVEIGWRYKKEVWGSGFATEAAAACLHYGFTVLHFNKVLSFTAAINLNSEKVMQRIGMRKIGFFDHPSIEKGNALCKHVVYAIDNKKENTGTP